MSQTSMESLISKSLDYDRNNPHFLTRWGKIGLLDRTPDVNKFVLAYALEVCLDYYSKLELNVDDPIAVAIFPIIVKLFNEDKLPQHIFLHDCEQLNYDATIEAYLKDEVKRDIPYNIEYGLKRFIPALVKDFRSYIAATRDSGFFDSKFMHNTNSDLEAEMMSIYCEEFNINRVKF